MLNARQQHCLKGIGITHWRERSKLPVTEVPIPQRDSSPPPATPDRAPVQHAPRTATPATQAPLKPEAAQATEAFVLDDWSQTLAAIETCTNCALAENCTRKVPGKGNQQADLMIIGEAPGRDEDLQGLPFVGRAGQLLDKMLKAIDLDLEQVYITNILKCRPPNNRDPQPAEVAACSQFLQAQICLLKPRVLLSVGRISAQNLLQEQRPLGQLRRTQHQLPGTDLPLLVTYHPAYLVRNPADKVKAWEDLKKLYRLLHAND